MTDLQIRGLLLAKGYSMLRAAEEIGVSFTTVSEVIKRRRTSRRVRVWIAEKIGLSVDQIWPPKAS